MPVTAPTCKTCKKSEWGHICRGAVTPREALRSATERSKRPKQKKPRKNQDA